MSEENEQTDKAARKKNVVDVVSWIVIVWLAFGLIWGIVHTVFLGGYSDIYDLFCSIGVLDGQLDDYNDWFGSFLVVAGYVVGDLLPAAAGIFACTLIVDEYAHESLTAGAAVLLCIVTPFAAGLAKKLWELFVYFVDVPIGEAPLVGLVCMSVTLVVASVVCELIKKSFAKR